MSITRDRIHQYLPFICLAIVVIVFGLWSGGKLFSSKSLIIELFTLLIGTCGMVFILSQGCMDFSIAGNLIICCIVGAKVSHINPYLSIIACLVVGAAIGCIVGSIHAFLKVDSFIASLSVSFILNGVAEFLLSEGSVSCDFSMLKWDSYLLRGIVAVIVVVVTYLMFEKTKIGKQNKIVGSNMVFAEHIGINVKWVKVRGFMIMGIMAGIVAFFCMIRSGTASTSTGAGFQVNTLNALLIGGMAISGGASCKHRSALFGAIILAVMSIGMSLANVSSMMQQLVEGIVYLAAICLTFDKNGQNIMK